MDVSEEILQNHLTYGASDYTGAHTLSASRSLNYAKGPSIQRPIVQELDILPFTFDYKDTVGLFGAENCFVRIDINIDTSVALECVEEAFWECALIQEIVDRDPYYDEAEIDLKADLETVNEYEPANLLPNSIPSNIYDPYVSVDLHNLKTGNQYLDDWLDVRMYNKEREPIAGNHTYVRFIDVLYIGFHARNTRRLPYDVKVVIGREIRSGLPSTDCYDDWAVLPPNNCLCIEEKGWVCAEIKLFNENYAGWQQAEIDRNKDLVAENTYDPSRISLQGSECIIDALSGILGLPPGNNFQIPPPKKAQMSSEPCCSTCH